VDNTNTITVHNYARDSNKKTQLSQRGRATLCVLKIFNIK